MEGSEEQRVKQCTKLTHNEDELLLFGGVGFSELRFDTIGGDERVERPRNLDPRVLGVYIE